MRRMSRWSRVIALVFLGVGWGRSGVGRAAPGSTESESEALTRRYMQLYEEGKYANAARLAKRACSVLGEEQGKTSIEYAGCLDDLGVFYKDQGEYGKAEPLHQRALAIREKALGLEHPQVAESLHNLAVVYHEQGAYAKAEPPLKQALAIWEKALGPDHPNVAHGLDSLAGLYESQGAYGKSEPLYEQALAIREKTLGPDHPSVAMSLNNLAYLYDVQGNYGEAKLLYERALDIREKMLGPDHPSVAMSLNNLAFLYKVQGEYGKAEPLYKRALAINEAVLGPYHPSVAIILNNLAALYDAQGMYGKTEPLYQRALAINETALGPDHPNVAVNLNNLAELYKAQGAYDKAEPFYERALTIREKVLGPDHADVAISHNNLATLYYAQGAYGKAEQLYDRALAVTERALGPYHPDVATTLNNLALLHEARGEYGKSKPLKKRALAIAERALGSNHPDVALSLNNLAALYAAQGMFRKAEPLHKRALAIREKALGPDHPDVAISLNNLAMGYKHQGAYGDAEPLCERALAIFKNTLGPDHPRVAQILNHQATLYHDQGKHDSALKPHHRALDIEDTNLVRTLTVANESRKLAFVSTLSGSLHYAISLHLRVVPEHDAIATLALTTLLRRKSRVQDLVTQSNAALRRSLPEDDRHLLDDLTDVDSRLSVLTSRGPGTLAIEEYSQQVDRIRGKRDQLWTELAEHSAIVASLDHPITIADVQRALPTGSALVEFIQYVPQHDDAGRHLREHEPKAPPHYAAYLVFHDHFDWVDLGPAGSIDEHVEAFRWALQTNQAIPTDLYDAIMRPIVDKLGSAHNLIIAPSGDLSLIPFGALHDGKRYLIEQYDLRYVTTGRDLLQPPATPLAATTQVTIVASPTGQRVPAGELEADFLTGFFPKTRVLQGDEATETNVRTIERPLIFHLATHGFFGQARNDRDNPLFRSGLVLADIDRVDVDRKLDDGKLTAYEVSGMDLRGTQLVVLSACDTGKGETIVTEGKLQRTESVFGLRRAFATAGARTTVMSMWEVAGATTQHTMEAYYRKLAEGMGRGEAMQAVQLEMLRTEEHRHPKHWAAFIVSGDDTPMVFPKGERPRAPDPGPPELELDDKKGLRCAIAKSSDRPGSNLMMLVGLLGLVAIRRRER